MDQSGGNKQVNDVQKFGDIETIKSPLGYPAEAEDPPSPPRDVDVPKPPSSYPAEGED